MGEGYPGTDGAPAITIFQCVQSISAGVAFLYNGLGQIALKWELLILVSIQTDVTLVLLLDQNLVRSLLQFSLKMSIHGIYPYFLQVVFGTSGTISFILADWNLRKKGPTQRPN